MAQPKVLTDIESVEQEVDHLHTMNTSRDREIAYLKLKQAAADRVTNGTTFADDMAGNGFGMTLDTTKSKSTVALTAGTTILNGKVDSVVGFVVGQKVTVFDDVAKEVVTITIANGTNLECSPLTNSYKKGAWIARSTMNADGTFPNFEIIGETFMGSLAIVNGNFDTSGNGNRKLIRLSNGWLIAGARNVSSNAVHLFKSTDLGQTWTQLVTLNASSDTDFALASRGTKIYCIISYSTNVNIPYYVIEATTASGTLLAQTGSLGSGYSSIGRCSLIVNNAGTEIHAVWSASQPAATDKNLFYVKGTLNVDGVVTWEGVQKLTTNPSVGMFSSNPSIVINATASGYPVILYNFYDNNFWIKAMRWNGSSWTDYTIYKHLTNGIWHDSPSAVFVPQSINGLANGRIWVTWHGYDDTDASVKNIRVSYSDDGGTSWSGIQKLTSGNLYTQEFASITANKSNEVYILWYGRDANDTHTDIRSIKYSSNSWGSISVISPGVGESNSYPSTLFDLANDYIALPFIQDTPSNIGFYAQQTNRTQTPLLTGTAIYKLPSTDYVGAFVQKAGAVSNIDAYINDVLMTEELDVDEYMFTKTLPAPVPVELRLEMSRANASGNTADKIKRILGGIA